jgi:hypothetical protein
MNNTIHNNKKEKSGRDNSGPLFRWLRSSLLTQTEAGNQGAVRINVLAFEVIQQFTTLANHTQQTTT